MFTTGTGTGFTAWGRPDMERFLRYSLENKKKIRVLLMDGDGAVTQMNLTVTALETESFSYLRAGKKHSETLPLNALLSAGYARGDHGEA